MAISKTLIANEQVMFERLISRVLFPSFGNSYS